MVWGSVKRSSSLRTGEAYPRKLCCKILLAGNKAIDACRVSPANMRETITVAASDMEVRITVRYDRNTIAKRHGDGVLVSQG